MSDSDGSGFGWFLAGLGIGAVIGLLYAPQSGAETREAIRKTAEEGREKLRTQVQGVRDQANQWADRGKDFVQQQKDQFRSAYEAGRQAYKETTAPSDGSTNL